MAGDPPLIQVKWNGSSITERVRSVQVEDDDRLIDKVTVVLADPHLTAPDFHPDQSLEVTMGWKNESAKLFDGIVQNAVGSNAADGTATMTVIAYDKSCLMHREPRSQFFQGALSSVVTTVLGNYHWATPRVTCDPDPVFTDHPRLQQTGMTDLQFLQWLAWRYGHRAFCEWDGDKQSFFFTSNRRLLQEPPMGTLQWCRGLRQLTEFSYQRVASRAARQQIATVPSADATPEAPTQGDQPPLFPPAPISPDRAATVARTDPGERTQLLAGDTLARSNPAPPPAPRTVPGVPSDPSLATAVTAVDPTRVLGLRGTGRAQGTIMLRAKGKVTIEGLAPWAEGDWYVRQAVHSFQANTARHGSNASYETRFTVTR